jgi:hypothetical protein
MQQILNTTNSVLLQTVLLLMSKNLQDTGTTDDNLQPEIPENSKLKHIFISYYNYIFYANLHLFVIYEL